jgi:hypothetical protein
MNVTDSEDGKYHQRNVKMEKELTSQSGSSLEGPKLKKMPHLYGLEQRVMRPALIYYLGCV